MQKYFSLIGIISIISMYSNLKNTDGNWKVELSQNPMPGKPAADNE